MSPIPEEALELSDGGCGGVSKDDGTVFPNGCHISAPELAESGYIPIEKCPPYVSHLFLHLRDGVADMGLPSWSNVMPKSLAYRLSIMRSSSLLM